MSFQPDYRNIVDVAWNRVPARLPLYEHLFDLPAIERVLGVDMTGLYTQDKDAFFREFCRFFFEMGFDTVSYECGIPIPSILPGCGALGAHRKGVIQTREDFENYPWDQIEERYFAHYAPDWDALRKHMPEGMMAVGGVGNGIFECVQDLTGYIDLCYMREDDPELYADLFAKMCEVHLSLWKRFLREYGDMYCVCRFGDDLGFKSSTLLHPDDLRRHVIPGYRSIIEQAHRTGKPFLIHSCGNIFDIMEDLIDAGMNAKHSNEDQIAPFCHWVERYGDRISFFGGIDADALCRLSLEEITAYVTDVIEACEGRAFAFGSGNSIAHYVPTEKYLHMVRLVRTLRGEDLSAL